MLIVIYSDASKIFYILYFSISTFNCLSSILHSNMGLLFSVICNK